MSSSIPSTQIIPLVWWDHTTEINCMVPLWLSANTPSWSRMDPTMCSTLLLCASDFLITSMSDKPSNRLSVALPLVLSDTVLCFKLHQPGPSVAPSLWPWVSCPILALSPATSPGPGLNLASMCSVGRFFLSLFIMAKLGNFSFPGTGSGGGVTLLGAVTLQIRCQGPVMDNYLLGIVRDSVSPISLSSLWCFWHLCTHFLDTWSPIYAGNCKIFLFCTGFSWYTPLILLICNIKS